MKRLLSIVLAVLFVFSLAACTGNNAAPAANNATQADTKATNDTEVAAAAASDELYGMVVFFKGSEFFNWCYAGFQDAAAVVGAKTELMGPADANAKGEADAVEQLLAKQAKGIAVTACDADTLVGSIDKAIASTVPVLTFDSDSPKSKRLMFVGTNHYNAGFAAGKAIGEKLGDKARVGISMVPGLDAIKGRIEGFKAGLNSVAPGAQVVAEVNDEQDVNKAEQVLTAMLQAKPEINSIFCTTGNSATGAVKSTINVGRNTGDNAVTVCGYAIDVPVLEMVESGELAMTVAQSPYIMGVEAFWHLYAAAHPTQFKNQKYPGMGDVTTADIDTGVTILTKGNPLIDVLKVPAKIK